MIKPRTGRWKDLSKTKGLLLFAQRVEEALFEYSLDSYKAPALNTHTRAQELLRAISEVLDQRLMAKALAPLIAELAHSISADTAAKALLGPHAPKMSTETWWQAGNLRQLETQAEMLRGFLRKHAYEEELVRQLRPLIAADKDKARLLSLTGDLLNEWIRLGFSRHFIYYRAKAHFFSLVGPPITGMESFDKFVESFTERRRPFDVVIRGPAGWLPLAKVVPDELVRISATAPKPKTDLPKENLYLSKPHDGVYFTFEKVDSLDARAAQAEAGRRLKVLASVASLHVHKTPLAFDGWAVAYDENYPVVLRPLAEPIHMEEDCRPGQLPERFARTIAAFGPRTLTQDSWGRLRASLDLHAAAINSADPSVQLTGLWAALEALLPAPADDSKIGPVVDALVPALCRFYAGKLFQDLHATLDRHYRDTYKTVLAKVPTDLPPFMKCAFIVAIPGNEPLRDILYAALDENPLLRFRIFALMCAFKHGDAALGTLRAHEERVRWHVLRIYRARNLMIHSGRSLPYRDSLLENLHSYFHELIRALERLCAGPTPPADLDSAVMRLRMDHDNHTAALKQLAHAKTAAETLRDTILGPGA